MTPVGLYEAALRLLRARWHQLPDEVREELAQEAAVRALAPDVANRPAYARRVAHNLACDVHRVSSYRSSRLRELRAEEQISPAAAVDARHDLAVLSGLIDSAPAATAAVLRTVLDGTYDEARGTDALDRDRWRVRKHRAFAWARRALAEVE